MSELDKENPNKGNPNLIKEFDTVLIKERELAEARDRYYKAKREEALQQDLATKLRMFKVSLDSLLSTVQQMEAKINNITLLLPPPLTNLSYAGEVPKKEFRPGDQIIYIPFHAKGDWTHKDCERGFVTGVSYDGRGVYCRFWKKPIPPAGFTGPYTYHYEVANKSGSQLCNPSNIHHLRYMDQEIINKWMDQNYPNWRRPGNLSPVD